MNSILQLRRIVLQIEKVEFIGTGQNHFPLRVTGHAVPLRGRAPSVPRIH